MIPSSPNSAKRDSNPSRWGSRDLKSTKLTAWYQMPPLILTWEYKYNFKRKRGHLVHFMNSQNLFHKKFDARNMQIIWQCRLSDVQIDEKEIYSYTFSINITQNCYLHLIFILRCEIIEFSSHLKEINLNKYKRSKCVSRHEII